MLELDKFIDGILNENVTCDNIELSRQVSDQWLDKKNKLKLNGYLHEKHWMPLKKTYNYINHSYQTSILWAKASFLNDFFRRIFCQQIVSFKTLKNHDQWRDRSWKICECYSFIRISTKQDLLRSKFIVRMIIKNSLIYLTILRPDYPILPSH